MRVTTEQIKFFNSAIEPFIISNEQVELRLFGSRVNDKLLGGDIDLLLITHSEQQHQNLLENKPQILAKLYLALDEENIDIHVCTINDIEHDPFVHSIHSKSVIINKWP